MFFRNISAAERSARAVGELLIGLLPQVLAPRLHYDSATARLRLDFSHPVLKALFCQSHQITTNITLTLIDGQVYIAPDDLEYLNAYCRSLSTSEKNTLKKSLHDEFSSLCKLYVSAALGKKLSPLENAETLEQIIKKYKGEYAVTEIKRKLALFPSAQNRHLQESAALSITHQVNFLHDFERTKIEVTGSYHQEHVREYLQYIELQRSSPATIAIQITPEVLRAIAQQAGMGPAPQIVRAPSDAHIYKPSLVNFIEVCNSQPLVLEGTTAQEKEHIKLLEHAHSALCCKISLSFCHTPVRIEGDLFDLKWLEKAEKFNDPAGFPHPLTRVRITKSQIQMATDVREATSELLSPQHILNNAIRQRMFIKIYQALHAGQSRWPKSNWVAAANLINLPADEAVALITEHAKKPHSRTQVAWNLVNKYRIEDIPDNIFLVKDIYLDSFERSWPFRMSRFGKQLFWRVPALQKHLETVTEELPASDSLKPYSRLNNIISTLRI